MLGTVCRVGDLLDLFDDEVEWGATAVSRELQITKSQAHEMLVSLEAIGLLRRAGRGRFRLGWRAVTLSQTLLRTELTAAESRIIREFGRHLGIPIGLIAYDGGRCVRIAGYGPDNHSRGPAELTGKVSAAGKVLLSGMPENQRAPLVARFDLEIEIEAVRERQVAFEVDGDRRGVAAPVFAPDGTLLAALSLTVDPDTWAARDGLLTRAVTGTASRLSESLRRRTAGAFVIEEPALRPS